VFHRRPESESFPDVLAPETIVFGEPEYDATTQAYLVNTEIVGIIPSGQHAG